MSPLLAAIIFPGVSLVVSVVSVGLYLKKRGDADWALDGWNWACGRHEDQRRIWRDERAELIAERDALAARLTRKPAVMAQRNRQIALTTKALRDGTVAERAA